MAAGQEGRSWRAWFAVLQILVSAGLLALLAGNLDPGVLRKALASASPVAILVAVALHTVILALLGLRWWLLIDSRGPGTRPGRAVSMTFTATLLNLLLPTGLGGDVVRMGFSRVDGSTLRGSASASIFDRGLGLLALAAIVSSVGLWPWPDNVVAASPTAVALSSGLILGVPMALVLVRRWPGMAEEREGPVLSRVILAFLLSVAGHLIAVTVAWVLADGMGHELTAAQALLSIPVVLLAALVPVSVGGWGVRESIAAIVLARIGWTMEDAVALSLIFGLTQLFAASPGALLRLQSPGREEEE